MYTYTDSIMLYNQSNIKKIAEVHKTEYSHINTTMDGSISGNNERCLTVEAQQNYFAFKDFVAEDRETMNGYDPDNNMISESIAMILIATLKIAIRKVKTNMPEEYKEDSQMIYLPTSYIMKRFYKYLFVADHLKSIIFGVNTLSQDFESNQDFIELVEALSDSSLGGIDTAYDEQFEEYSDNGKSIISRTSCMTHSKRTSFWTQKLSKLLSRSNKQWLFDQFKYCKLLILNNSYKMAPSEVPEVLRVFGTEKESRPIKEGELVKENPKASKFIEEKKIVSDIDKSWEEVKDSIKAIPKFRDTSRFVENPKFMNYTVGDKVSILNVSALVGHVIGFEAKVRRLAKGLTNNGKDKIKKRDFNIMKSKNYFMTRRFLSSSLGTNYEAYKAYCEK